MSPHDLAFYVFAEPALSRMLRGLGKMLGTVAESAPASARGQVLYACAEAPDAPSLRRAWGAQQALLESVADLLGCSRVIALGLPSRCSSIADSSGRFGAAGELVVQAVAGKPSPNTDS